MANTPDPKKMTLAQYLRVCGTRTGTQTINGVTYKDLNEVDWRRANHDWKTPRPSR